VTLTERPTTADERAAGWLHAYDGIGRRTLAVAPLTASSPDVQQLAAIVGPITIVPLVAR
jgi:hypothetical protein